MAVAACALAGCGQDAPVSGPRVLLDEKHAVSELQTALSFKVTDAGSGYRLVEIDQTTVDVQLELRVGDERLLYDAPAGRAGPERACVFAPGGDFEVRVSSNDRVAVSGKRFRIVVTSLRAAAPASGDAALVAECQEARGATNHEDWKTADPAAQVADFVSAANIWERRGSGARAAMARLQAAWMITRQLPASDANLAKAIALGERAQAGFQELDNCVGVSHATLHLAVPRGLVAMQHAKNGQPDLAAREFAAIKGAHGAAIKCYKAAGLDYFTAAALNSLGSVSHYSGDDAAALTQLGESAALFRSISELEGASLPLANANIILAATGQYDKAVKGFEEMLKKGETASTDVVLADILDSIAITHVAVGNYDKALGELLQSSAVHERVQDMAGLARSLNGFATAYLSIGDAGAARDYAQRAVSVRDRIPPADRGSTESEQIMSLLIEGNAQRQLGDLPAAIAAHQKALGLARADSLGVQARLELARDRLRNREPADALRLLGDAAAQVRDNWGTLKLQIELERARGHAQSGAAETARAVLAKLKGRFAAAGQPTLEIEVLQQLASAEHALGNHAAARRAGDECIARLEKLRLATVNPVFRARLVATHRAAYELKVEMLLGERTRAATPASRDKLLREVLAASDTARAGLVRELATAAPPVEASGEDAKTRALAADIALQEYTLQREEYGITLADGGAPIRERLADLRARFDSSTAHRVMPGAGFESAQYDWGEIPADAAVLSFVRSGSGLRRYLFTREGALELPEIAGAPVAAALAILQRDVVTPRENEIDALQSLSRLLLPSTLDKRRWIIVADAATAAVPFAGLSMGAEYRPLVLDHELTMALTTRDALRIARSGAPARRADLGRVAIFADPVFSPLDTRVKHTKASQAGPFLPTPRLAATAYEAAAIVEQLPGADLKVFAGFDASRAAVLSPFVNQASVLHFATHATSSDEWPHGSGLMLSGVSRDGEIVNGYLSTLDLLVSRRATDLVVLSACDTARGESTQSENVAGLARAFLGSGARRVVATLWAVEDAATATLMREFYRRLAQGRGAPAALREAQAEMAASEHFSRPAAWAAFVIYENALGS